MPIYEYRCSECGVKFEKLVFRSDAPLPACPSCKSEAVSKLMSVPSVGGGGGASTACGLNGGGSCGSSGGFG